MKTSVKTALLAIVMVFGAVFTSSCGTPFPLGCLYTNVWTPGSIGSGKIEYNRRGHASCYSWLGWFAGGNASHNLAAKGGDISEITWTTWHIENYCGIFGRFTNVVYGFGEKADPTVRSVADFE